MTLLLCDFKSAIAKWETGPWAIFSQIRQTYVTPCSIDSRSTRIIGTWLMRNWHVKSVCTEYSDQIYGYNPIIITSIINMCRILGARAKPLSAPNDTKSENDVLTTKNLHHHSRGASHSKEPSARQRSHPLTPDRLSKLIHYQTSQRYVHNPSRNTHTM